LPDLIVERADGIVRATLNRPSRKNALTFELFDALGELFAEVERNDGDRVLVLRGAGGSFSSGMDLTDRPKEGEPPSGSIGSMQRIHATALALHELRKPTIAAVEGVAVGAGMSLALGCDLVVASRTARFCAIFVRRGLSIDFGLSWILPRLVGGAKAKELALLGEEVSGDAAARIGLVSRVVDPEDLDASVEGLAQRLANGPTVALANDVALLGGSLQSSFADAVTAEALAQAANVATDDVAEAMAAFLEKRDARFQGR
jgi:enoyl-CoA hydratase/carnithine racemase